MSTKNSLHNNWELTTDRLKSRIELFFVDEQCRLWRLDVFVIEDDLSFDLVGRRAHGLAGVEHLNAHLFKVLHDCDLVIKVLFR